MIKSHLFLRVKIRSAQFLKGGGGPDPEPIEFDPYFFGSYGSPAIGFIPASVYFYMISAIYFYYASSSVVGKPFLFLSYSYSTFWRWPYVSRSNSSTRFELSTFFVSISASPTITAFQIASYPFSKVILSHFLSSMLQYESSIFTLLSKSPSIKAVSCECSLTYKCLAFITTFNCFEVVPSGIGI